MASECERSERRDGWMRWMGGYFHVVGEKDQNCIGVFRVFSLARRVVIIITRLRNKNQNNRREGIPNRTRDEGDTN